VPSDSTHPLPPAARRPALTPGLVFLFAFCCGAIVSNLYYAQPLIELIAPDIGLSAHAASFIVALTQGGYAIGLLFLVPLGDLMESRRLMVATLVLATVSLVGASLSTSAAMLLTFSVLIGFSSVSVQMMVPLAAAMAEPAQRGRVVGTVVGGLMFGVLLSRPLASFVADHFGWRAMFGLAAAMMVAIAILLRTLMPQRHGEHSAGYRKLLASMVTLVRTQPVLRQRSFYQACLFAALVLFWTAAPIELARRHGFSQSQIALFALVGAAGVLAGPVTGRLADAGWGRTAALGALALGLLSFLPLLFFPSLGVLGLGFTAVLLDMALQVVMVSGQREIYAISSESASRINSVFMTSVFLGGAAGAAMASALYERGGWQAVATTGALLVLVPLVKFVVDHGTGLGRQGGARVDS
jgi:predicted MFS family arabinose efflux permease